MMTTRVNLLPHREERRKRGRQHFFVLAGGTAILGVLIVGLMHTFYAAKIETQADRNRFLKGEIVKLDKDIAEIDSLKEQIQALLARKQVIETLQADRAQTVRLLDQLVQQTPDGIYLSRVVQKGLGVNIAGFAQSNARVSTLMRNIEASPWLERPQLIEVHAANTQGRRISEFTMNLALKRAEAPKDAAKAPAKAAAKKG